MAQATYTFDPKAQTLTIVLPLASKPYQRSQGGEGKNLTIATTSGNRPTDIVVDGKVLTVGVNAYIKADGPVVGTAKV